MHARAHTGNDMQEVKSLVPSPPAPLAQSLSGDRDHGTSLGPGHDAPGFLLLLCVLLIERRITLRNGVEVLMVSLDLSCWGLHNIRPWGVRGCCDPPSYRKIGGS